ncbi:MAG: hypothetical protein RPU42_14565 [Candidatus Sedimenticola sp. (ex Thyasira tokunagai)]
MPLAALLLSALKWAPAIFTAGIEITEAVTGEPVPGAATDTPETLANHIEQLPAAQRMQITQQVLDTKAQIQGLDTQRFLAMTDGDAEKIRATARPQIALRAMAIIETFAWCLKLLIIFTVLGWVGSLLSMAINSQPLPVSLWGELAKAAPVAEMIWAPLIASFWASVAVIRKYMGVRERDKAHEYELRAGKPLNSTNATIEAAGGAVAGIIKAFKKR